MASVVTTTADVQIAGFISKVVSLPANFFVAWGTGAGTAATSDTTLFTEGPEARSTATNTNPSSAVARHVGTITASAARAVTNAGVFDASTTGNLFYKSDFATVNLSTGDSIQFTFNVTVL